MTALSTDFTLDTLPAHTMAVLHALALLPSGESKAALLALLQLNLIRDEHGKAVNGDKLGVILGDLEHRGAIVRTAGLPYRIAPPARNAVLLQLMDEQAELSAWAELLCEHLPLPRNQWDVPSATAIQLRLWLAILQGKAEPTQQWLAQYQQLMQAGGATPQPPFKRLFTNAAGRQLFDRLDDDIQVLLLQDYLPDANWRLDHFAEGYRYALSRLDDGYRDWDDLTAQLLLQGIWRADFELVRQPGAEGDGLPVARLCYLPVLQGRFAEALSMLDDWLADIRAQTKKRTVDLPAPLNAFYCLALIGSQDKARQPQLKQAIASAIKQRYGHSYYVLQHLLLLQEGTALSAKLQLPDASALCGVDGLLLALGAFWLDVNQARTPAWQAALASFRDQMFEEGYVWVAEELAALLERQFGERRAHPRWHAERGLIPLVAAYQRQEAWQHALNALKLLGAGKSPEGKANVDSKQTRLAWLLTLAPHGALLEPREQKLGAKSQWSKGRAVALRRLLDEPESFDYLQEQDRQLLRYIRSHHDQHHYSSNSAWELDAEKALPFLVGHPAMFWGDAPDVHIDVVAGSVALQLQERDGQIRLRLSPAKITADSEVVWEKDTPTRLMVYSVSREVRQIAAILGRELTVPVAAKAQLVEAVTSIAPLVPIHSDLPELAANVDAVPADGTLYAHLLPLAQGLRMQLLVRPLPGGSWSRPGQGLETIVGELDGRTVQTQRRLKAEKAALQKVLDACPGLAAAESDGQEWQLPDPQSALQVLSELQALDASLLACVWPEGERMRIKGRRGLPQLAMGLKQQGDWFVLNGQLKLDDGRVLQLKELLALVQNQPGRFLQLGDEDWLALTDVMKKRLDELALLADHVGKDGVYLSALNAPLLAELAGEVGEFDADDAWQQQLAALESLRDYQPQVPSTLQATLRDYQQEGYAWMSRLARWGVGACLADDMGLGKTVQTLALLLERAPDGPQLVVAPTSVALNWIAEAARFAPTLKVRAYQQQRTLVGLDAMDLVIVSYGLLQQDADAFATVPWQTVVLDEAQAIKNAGTKRSQAAMNLQAGFRLAASGTPVENHLGELWNLFRFVNPGLLGSQERFAQRFATPIERGDKNARRALKQLIQPFILRRTKTQVLDELPPRTEITRKVPLSADELHLYEAMRQQAVEKLDELQGEDGKQMQVLAEITRLRRFCCHPKLALPDSTLSGSKLAAFADIADELLENGHKALVFSQFVDHLAIVRQLLDERGVRYQYLDGATPARERKARVDAFQKGEGDIFLISLKAGGTGLNLTAADYVIHLDPWWNPAVEDQASDRAYRMGQQRPVTIYRLVAEHTIEEQIVALHHAKRDLADSLLSGGDISAKLDAEALLALLKGDAA